MKSQYTKSSFTFRFYHGRPYLKCQQPMNWIKGSSLSYPPVSLEFSTMATHSRTKDCQKRGAATEHAEKKVPGGRATENAEEKLNAETVQAMEDAKADRANDTIENQSCKLADFFLVLVQDVWSHATEHEVDEHVSIDIAHEKIVEWGIKEREFYGERELLQHKKMLYIMTWNKAGVPKE